jgi:hypothetical protein
MVVSSLREDRSHFFDIIFMIVLFFVLYAEQQRLMVTTRIVLIASRNFV